MTTKMILGICLLLGSQIYSAEALLGMKS